MPRRSLTRRQLAQTAVAGAAAAKLASAATTAYTGPLDGVRDKVDTTLLDPVHYTLERYAHAPLRLTFRATTRPQAVAWQNELRPKIGELVGGFPAGKAPLNPQSLEVREFPTYRREKFLFTSRPGMNVLAYLLTPKAGTKPHSTLICVPGHGRGVDDIVGIDENGRDRTERVGYEFDFAIQAVEHGMAALAIEPLAFGCRRDARSASKGLTNSACQPSAGAALLLGETMIGWRVYDVMRAIDWIETRADLDAKRVGIAGISGGGTVSLFSTALEPRLKAALVSGYLNTFRDSIMSLSHCIDNYIPGILNWAEMYDVAGLIAPRPLFAESGLHDPIFPVAAARASFAKVQQVYRVVGAADQTRHDVFEGKHQFSGVNGLPFLAEKLKA